MKIIKLADNGATFFKMEQKTLGVKEKNTVRISNKLQELIKDKWIPYKKDCNKDDESGREYASLKNIVKNRFRMKKDEHWIRLCIDADSRIAYNQ